MLEESSLIIPGRKILILIALCWIIVPISCSYGDRSNLFQSCMHWCGIKNCSNTSSLAYFKATRPWYLTLLQWECWDECDYYCMWHAVKIFQHNGQVVPQFHGKWPFYRFWGIQEPASVLFSILNGLVHFVMWQKFRQSVTNCPFSTLWNVQALLSINAWFWSAVFHTRDTPLTEKLDYFCAFSLVIYSFYSLFVRSCSNVRTWMPLTIAVPFISYFGYHIYYLTFVRFDYGYNLKANIIIGLLNSFGWILWCYKYRQKKYVWKCAASVIAVNILLLLELCDFPPWKFLIDAHALWHLGTIPVPLLWYSFLIEDCLSEVRELDYCINVLKKVG
ncbi:post-GPI attachment to proteins factor 3-like [Uloborus diversus]|uniref:post-GPI attachment to proteins factor 3-like n=1 Tax=Uloborus diversus TaxID=327109 RepID=UPI0024096D47|nr:post-GPI attachment to proteins factor 3-like [Uloborus diversus]